MKLVIDRKRWYRGRDGDQSRLKRSTDDCMCCLGFLGEACGVAQHNLYDVAYPVLPEVSRSSGDLAWPKWLFGAFTPRGPSWDVRTELAIINDDEKRSDEDREIDLARVFAHYGVEVEFTG